MTKPTAGGQAEQRVASMLADPDRYFAAARKRARAVAERDVDRELDRRAAVRADQHPRPA